MLKRIIKLKSVKTGLNNLSFYEWVFIKNVKLCRLRKNLVIAGIGAFISSAVGGVAIAFLVAFLSCFIEEIYDMGIYDKKFSLSFATLSSLFSGSFSLNSNKELKHPKDIMLPNAPTVDNFSTVNHDEFSNAYQHAS